MTGETISDETNNTMAKDINVIEGHDIAVHSASDDNNEHHDNNGHGKKWTAVSN